MESWIQNAHSSTFPVENIPFGVVMTPQGPHAATAIGHFALDLSVLAHAGCFDGLLKATTVFDQPTLNAFMALGRPAWREARKSLQSLLVKGGNSTLSSNAALQKEALLDLNTVKFAMPIEIGDYTDFYASKEHAVNVGSMFRGRENALMPNWVHLPVGYHGRASSVVVSGTPLKRPSGQILNPITKAPEFSASKKMDFELEVAFIVGTGNALGDRIPIDEAEDHIFGMVLMNDWFEYVPLGPFLGKNFGTTISPWIVTLDALEPFRVAQPVQDPVPCEYLKDSADAANAYDVSLQVWMKPQEATEKSLISQSNLKYMYWSFKQQLAHHTINGCNMRTGDLCGSGTISGPTQESLGSLLELSANGTTPITLKTGEKRAFIEDGDEVSMTGFCEGTVGGKHVKFGFGDASGVLLPPSFSTRSL